MYRTVAGPCSDRHFGSMVQEAWEASGITQLEFATRMGVTQPRIFAIFGSESISERTLDRCMVALGCVLEVRILKG